MAKNIFPIIEIDAGRKVDFIMIRGMSLSPKSKSNQGTDSQGGARSMNNNYSGNMMNSIIMNGNGVQRGGMAGFGDRYVDGSRGAFSGYGR